MDVISLVGRNKGEVIDLPYDRALAAITNGTATATDSDASIETAIRALGTTNIPVIVEPEPKTVEIDPLDFGPVVPPSEVVQAQTPPEVKSPSPQPPRRRGRPRKNP